MRFASYVVALTVATLTSVDAKPGRKNARVAQRDTPSSTSSCSYTIPSGTPENFDCGVYGALNSKKTAFLYPAYKAKGFEECQDVCLDNAECLSFSYDSKNQQCAHYSKNLIQQGFTHSKKKTDTIFYNSHCFTLSCDNEDDDHVLTGQVKKVSTVQAKSSAKTANNAVSTSKSSAKASTANNAASTVTKSATSKAASSATANVPPTRGQTTQSTNVPPTRSASSGTTTVLSASSQVDAQSSTTTKTRPMNSQAPSGCSYVLNPTPSNRAGSGKLNCNVYGTLVAKKTELLYITPNQDYNSCRDICLYDSTTPNSGIDGPGCISFGFNSTSLDCMVYGQNLVQQGLVVTGQGPQDPDIIYANHQVCSATTMYRHR
jgi:hypothetical protein